MSASSVPLISKDPPKEPPPDYEFVSDPPSISAYDLDIVRLTAQVGSGKYFYMINSLRRDNNIVNIFSYILNVSVAYLFYILSL